jgi:hypothetical protein
MSIVILTETFTTPGNVTLTPPPGATGYIAEGIGGGAGASVWASPVSPKSGGGGGYAKTTVTSITGGTIPAYVGNGGLGTNGILHYSGEPTWVGSSDVTSSDCKMLAGGAFGLDGGGKDVGVNANKGDVTYNGGDGALNALDYGPGAAGGGAAGPNGIGANGSSNEHAPGSPGTGIGGTGDGGLTAGGTHGATHIITDGQDATGFGGGGGGGGAGGLTNGQGGDGGYPGGGGGVGTDATDGGKGGDGANGMLRIQWTAIPAPEVRTTQLPRLIAYRAGTPARQRQTAWTFILDGHRFYVLPLGEEGDWAYDTTTKEWCQLQTQAYDGINFTHGVMWGIRIIGGDYLYPILWEMDPSQSFDDEWRPVKHMVTGGIAARGRHAIGVANFTLTASVGDDASTAEPISLSFSDDNGVTWSRDFNIPLTDASNQLLMWSSLGSFAQPGRVFKITDYAGPVRLDGADCVLTIGNGADSGIADPEGPPQ